MSCSLVTEESGCFVVKVCADENSVALAAAEMFVDQYKKAISRSERFRVVLSGGNTPQRTYELLTQDHFKNQIHWPNVHIFWGDERCVEATDSRSNYGTAYRDFLSHVPIPEHQIHPMFRAQGSHEAALEYEALLHRYFAESLSCFDLVFLGLGENGHTASLFPDSPALKEKSRWVVATQNPNEDFARITLTFPLLNGAHLIIFLVTGKEKKEILKKVFAKEEPTYSLPARLIKPINGELIWLVDSSTQPYC